MNCIDYRRLISADPSHVGAEGLRHRMECRPCGAFAAQMQQLDSRIRDAMMVEPPRDLESRIMLAATGKQAARLRWYAVAATLVLGLGVTLGVLINYSPTKLPDQVMKHLYHEANLLVPAVELVARPRLIEVLEQTGVRLSGDVGEVSHAGICYFRGHLVSHLVVRGEHGPVTVMLLPDEKVSAPVSFDEGGFRGVIVPVKGGSIAIVGGEDESTEPVQRRFINAVEWRT